MREESKRMMEDGISILKGFGIKDNEIVITGSIALDIYGLLPKEHKVHDFDCYVIANNDRATALDAKIQDFIKQSNGCLISSEEYIENEVSHLFFTLFGKEINIWFFDESAISTNITYKGIKVQKPNEIIKRKLSYKRAKDFTDVLGIINLLTKKE